MKHKKSMLLLVASLGANACGSDATDVRAEGEPSIELGQLEEDVISGGTNWTGKNQIRFRTVSIYDHNAGGSFVGSGTLLKPDLLLTARYLVTTNGVANGPLNTPSNIRVRTGNLAPAPGANDICTGANRQPDCAVGATIVAESAATNLALVRLANPISHASMKVPFTPVLAEFINNSDVDNDTVLVSGWGQTSCGGGALSLSWGTMQADSGNGTINLVEIAGGQDVAPGDNGGPTWAQLAGFPQIGVHSTVGGACAGTNVDASLISNMDFIEDVLDSAAERENVNAALSSLNQVDFEAAPGAAPAWVIAGGKLKQNTNTGRSFALIKTGTTGRAALEFHRVNFTAQVTINSVDDDSAGIVFHYNDPDNYVLCRANDQDNVLEIVTRRFGVDTVQDSAPWNGLFSNLVVQAYMTDGQGRSTGCRFSGGGINGTTSFSYINGDGPYGGRIGVFSDFNNGATFNNFTSVH